MLTRELAVRVGIVRPDSGTEVVLVGIVQVDSGTEVAPVGIVRPVGIVVAGRSCMVQGQQGTAVVCTVVVDMVDIELVDRGRVGCRVVWLGTEVVADHCKAELKVLAVVEIFQDYQT